MNYELNRYYSLNDYDNRSIRPLGDQYKDLIMQEVDALKDSEHFVSVIASKLRELQGENWHRDSWWYEFDSKMNGWL